MSRERLANVFKNMFVETYFFNKMSKTFEGNVTPQEVLFGEVGKLQTLLASHLIRTVIYLCSKIYLGRFHLFGKRSGAPNDNFRKISVRKKI